MAQEEDNRHEYYRGERNLEAAPMEKRASDILDSLESNCRLSKQLLEDKILNQLTKQQMEQVDTIMQNMRDATYDGDFHDNYRLFSDAEIVTMICALVT